MTLDELRSSLQNKNVTAFLRVIRQGESSQSVDAYSMINGGGTFTDLSRHPFSGLKTTQGGKAAGAYQFIPTTWDELSQTLPGGDFSPLWQSIRCVQLIAERGALPAIMAGECAKAIEVLRPTWTSLPGAAESSGHYTLPQALAVFQEYGGTLAGLPVNPPPAVPHPLTPVLLKPKPTVRETETLTDIPAARLDELVAQFKAAGATVTVSTQPNGLYRLVANY